MQEKIHKELEELAESGREMLNHRAFRGPGMAPMNDSQISGAQIEYARFKTRALNLIGRSFGVDDDHYRELQQLGDFPDYPVCLGIVEAAVHAVESGILFNLKAIVAAELMGNHLEQAEALLGAGYHIPAASLTGAILEDTLRQLWIKRDWTVPPKTNINSLNTELAKVDEYNLLTQKQITAHADIRNNADHGHYAEFGAEDVEGMVKWVRRFAKEYLR